MVYTNPSELALMLLKSAANHRLSLAINNRALMQEAFKIASQYEKSNEELFVFDTLTAKVINTTKAEYELSLSKDKRYTMVSKTKDAILSTLKQFSQSLVYPACVNRLLH